jgi:hypothetical protein
MDHAQEHFLNISRRQFLSQGAGSIVAALGATALSSMASEASAQQNVGGALGMTHFAPKAKRVIFLHQNGAPSQHDLFDYKPDMHKLRGQDLRSMPQVFNNQRITGMTSGQGTLPIAPSPFKFAKHENGGDGVWLSELLPHTASIAKDICVVRSMHTPSINHAPGVTMFQTGHEQPGRPSIGAWLSYGLGSDNRDLPAFVVMISQGKGQPQALFSRLWGSAFLPSEHQGTVMRSGKDPILFLNNPEKMTREHRRYMLDMLGQLNEHAHEQHGDRETLARIQQYEMAYRMQMSVPDLADLSDESDETFELYGPNAKKPGTYAHNALMARRLAERGVRFIQLYHRGWDQHQDIPGQLPLQCKDTDQPSAALVKDLKRRGLLDETLVVWGGEFGRTAYSQGDLNAVRYGRDHHPRCFSIWMAGGGIKPGTVYGQTDEIGYNITQDPVHVHDLHATMLHLLGIDHERLTYRYQGRRFRLTDVHGHVVKDILA